MAAFVDRLLVRKPDGEEYRLEAFFNSLDEIAIWRAEFVRLGFSIIEHLNEKMVELGESRTHHNRMLPSQAGNPPEAGLDDAGYFGWWFAIREVERWRVLVQYRTVPKPNWNPPPMVGEGI